MRLQDDGYVDITELARELDISETTIRRYIKKGLPVYRLGERKLIFKLTECRDWLIRKN